MGSGPALCIRDSPERRTQNTRPDPVLSSFCAMGSFGCPHEVDERCQRVNGAYCVPGMRGCVLQGKVEFPDGKIPRPRWPRHERAEPPARDD
jgi:hypothetical protein